MGLSEHHVKYYIGLTPEALSSSFLATMPLISSSNAVVLIYFKLDILIHAASEVS